MVEAVTTTRRRANSDGTSHLGPLVLRICGSHREGQIVRLQSTKCTIGSGEHCTLRIRARGVQPLHCVLIRKAARTIVRRWAKDTRLNGAPFTDAQLNAGDRLSIGPIEFEVLESGGEPQADLSQGHRFSAGASGGGGKRDSLVEHLVTAKDLARKRTEKILRRLREANHRIEELSEQLCDDGTDREIAEDLLGGATGAGLEHETLRAEQIQFGEEKAELRRCQQELDKRSQSIEEQQAAFAKERQDWLEERRKSAETHERALDDREKALGTQEANLADRLEVAREEQCALAESREEFEDVRSRWEAEQSARNADFESREAELERRSQEIDSARVELEAERRRLKTELADLAPQQNESGPSEAGEGERLAELEEDRADLERQREELAREREELDSQREAIRADREAVEGDRERNDARASEVEEQRIEVERESGVVAQEAAELRVERERFQEEQDKWEAAQLDAQKQIEQRAEQLDRQKEALEQQKEELANDRVDWEGLQAEAEAKLASRAEQLDERERELDERTAEFERMPQPASGGLDFFDDNEDVESPEKSTTSSELFRLMEGDSSSQTQPLGEFSELQSILRSNKTDPDEDEAAASEEEPSIVMREEEGNTRRSVSEILLEDPVIADSFVTQPSEESQSTHQPGSEASCVDDEEQSIEQYMAGLLARVSGGSASSPAAARSSEQAQVPGAPISEAAEGTNGEVEKEASLSGLVEDEQNEVREAGPRAKAPERAEDLVTLRELANLSAKSALDTHARRRLIRSVNGKLAVVGVALATAGVLFWRWTVVPDSTMHYYMGLAVILVAVLWGVQYVALAGYAYLTSRTRNNSDGTGSSASGNEGKDVWSVQGEGPVVAKVVETGIEFPGRSN